MKTVVAVYTGQGLIDSIKQAFRELLPDCRLVNILDDSIIHDVMKAGAITPAVSKRLLQYYTQAEEMGADAILNTCSSVGEIADRARSFIRIPIVKIDEKMAEHAASRYKNIGVIATLSSTLAPTMRLINATAAQLGREVILVDGLAEGAYDALVNGNAEEHDRFIEETAHRIADRADAFVLAQGSMARMEEQLSRSTGKPVLSSLHLGVNHVKSLFEQTAGSR
ncbi:aspartate/glutamate racemase family protein [Paenibacillus tarimensis]